ncbi:MULTISPECIES: Smr/MutS family protein [Legionella]|uniref:DNA mismatch repair protein-like protein n=1 Tax=Legionella drozanskii LLAP-1 TaxID=1212489 RepID=A0A0W0SRI6_9GAMM|nr:MULTISPECIES: Smr/MutS family protein [Legionella]KTC86018.1 DNA mismatch repair protein-like protein [Legionella drozanskii LLAP-1]PJE10019.1 MAG: DNA mismatch repair protein MutS [Legionella sp.]
MSDDSLSDEDKALFRKMMSGVKPLQKTNKIQLSTPPKVTKIHKRESIPRQDIPTIYLSDYYTNEVQAQTILSYSSHSIPSKRLRELKMGLIPWEARLDLHGQKTEAARESLIKFITQQTNLAHRSLLIIHGKGSRQGETPVLKNLVNHWLPQFSQVLAFHSALARDGGEGALYVLLKRNKLNLLS